MKDGGSLLGGQHKEVPYEFKCATFQVIFSGKLLQEEIIVAFEHFEVTFAGVGNELLKVIFDIPSQFEYERFANRRIPLTDTNAFAYGGGLFICCIFLLFLQIEIKLLAIPSNNTKP